MEPLRILNSRVMEPLRVLHFHEWLLLVALISATTAFLLRKAFLGRTTQVRPPGPPAWPILGHLHLLGDLPHQSLSNLSHTYGPLMGLRLGAIPAIVASSPEIAKEILLTHDLAFAYRPRTAAAVHLCFDCSDVAYAPLGPYWKFLRQLYATELFSPKRMDSFRHVREGEVRELLSAVRRCGGEGEGGVPVEVRQNLVTASNNINCRMVMGKKIKEVSSARAAVGEVDLHRLIEDVLHLLGVFYLGDYIPWLAWLDPNGYLKRMKATGQRTKDLLQAVIDERRESNFDENGAPAAPCDLLDVLVAASHSKQQLDKDVSITDNNIMAAILDVFVGGAETSAITVEWALAELINNPRVMRKLQEELDKVVGKGRLVEESDMENLPYLGNVIKEAMRLHPIAPFLIPREAVQGCVIKGYQIQPKTLIYVNSWAIGRDSSTWERPLEFSPDRFIEKNIDLKGQHFDFLPFGLGRRRCPGWALGISNVHLMLATLIQGFTWEIPCGSSESTLDMSEKFGLTVSMAKPLCAIATPRLPLHLY